MQAAARARPRAWRNAGTRTVNRTAMIEMTTSASIRVKALGRSSIVNRGVRFKAHVSVSRPGGANHNPSANWFYKAQSSLVKHNMNAVGNFIESTSADPQAILVDRRMRAKIRPFVLVVCLVTVLQID